MDVQGRRVLVLIPSISVLGGAERQALLFARIATEHGATVQVWGKDAPGEVAAQCARIGVATRQVGLDLRVRPLRLWFNLRRFANLARRERFDWIAPYTTGPNIFAAMTWQKTGARSCIWNQRDEGQRLGIKPVDFKAAGRVRVLVSNSAHAAQMLVKRLKVDPARTRVVHNGVKLAQPLKTPQQWRSDLGIPPDVPLAVMVANLTARKDHETLVRAWGVVHAELPSAVLVLAGDHGERTQPCRDLAAQLGIAASVKFPGAVADVSGLLSAATIGVFSSRLEGCPNGVLECMASGLSVAGTDIPGISEALGAQGQPWLAPAGDHAALGARILKLMLDPSARAAEGRRNRLRIESEFSPERMVEGTVKALVDAESSAR